MPGTPSVIMYPSIRWRNLGIASFIDPFYIVQIYIIDFFFPHRAKFDKPN